MEEKSKDDAKAEDLSQVKPAQESDVNNIVPKEAEEEDDEHEDDEDEFEPTDRNDDTRFEAIQEEFEFDGKLIKPSYCVLPFITDDEVEACTKRNIAVSSCKTFNGSKWHIWFLHRNIMNSLRNTPRTRKVRWSSTRVRSRLRRTSSSPGASLRPRHPSTTTSTTTS